MLSHRLLDQPTNQLAGVVGLQRCLCLLQQFRVDVDGNANECMLTPLPRDCKHSPKLLHPLVNHLLDHRQLL